MDGQIYLSRINCEYRDFLGELCRNRNVSLTRAYRSEREDWIQMMVASGMGVCFMPQYSTTVPGVLTRPVVEPSVDREVCLVTVSGRRHSAPLAAFVRGVKTYPWPDANIAAPPRPDANVAAPPPAYFEARPSKH
jgi:DNA-binding transcriptional LysR family regulator